VKYNYELQRVTESVWLRHSFWVTKLIVYSRVN